MKETTKLSEPLGQTVLSSKHQQITNSNTIVFNNDFHKVFELISSEIALRDDDDIDEELFILFDNIKIEETEDEDLYSTSSFKLIDIKGNVIYNIVEENGSNMYLSDQLLALYKGMKDKNKPISLESFDSDSDVLFTVEIKNKELTEPIKIIQKILNTNDKMGAKTLSDVCQIFAEALINIGIKYDLVHAECIIRSLLRKKSNKLEFPDWTEMGDHNDYQILSLNNALFNNPSALVSMSYGYLRKQLLSPELYKKDSASHLDPLFVSQLSKYIDQ